MAGSGGMALAWRIARRELRGGLRGFRVFLACLILGVAAIAGVGIVREAIRQGLQDQGAVLLGGDARMRVTGRAASEAERAFIAEVSTAMSEVVDLRSMVLVGEDRALTQLKGVDDAWPLLGNAVLDPPMPLADALAGQGAVPGAVMDRVLVDRLGLSPGDTFRLGRQDFQLSAVLVSEPDNSSGGFGLGPRTLVRTADLRAAGLVGPGSMYESEYRMILPPGTDLAALKARATAAFADAGLRWQDRTRPAPGVERFVDQMGAFLVLVGLAGLAVGGVGISAAVRAWLEGKVPTIATLRTLGAGQGVIFRVYLIQVILLTCLGIFQGLILGVAVPLGLAPLINSLLPVPAVFAPWPLPMIEAAYYGLLISLLFTVWPLARAARVRAAALYRKGPVQAWPAPVWWLVTALLAVALIAGAALFSGVAVMAVSAAGGVIVALLALWLAALGLRRLARWLSQRPWMRGHPGLRLAVSAIGGPGSETQSVVLSLGLGLTVLAAVGQIDANLRTAIERDLPDRAPAYFILDIQPDQLDPFMARMDADAAVERVETAPMLRGVLTRINDRPASEVAGGHWVVRGDRGITYADALPNGVRLTGGTFWPEGYDGPAQVSFAQAEAEEIGLKLGDRLTLNVLGRDIEAEITSFRHVDFATGGIGFVMMLNASALRGAPHTHIATVYADQAAEGRILRDISKTWPNITAISIREAVGQVTVALDAIATATAWAASATLLTGFMVLIGAAAAGERARVYESAVLKTLGASRARILGSFALRSALMGAAAGLVAVGAGAAAGWAVMRFVMEVPYRFEPLSALGIILGGVAAVLLAGVLFTLRPLAARPARVLRAQD